MNFFKIDPAYRVISYVSMIQIGIIIGGTFFVGAMLKAWGYPNAPLGVDQWVYRTSALFIRHYGFFLLLIPVLWVASAFAALRVSLSIWILRGIVLVGIVAIIIAIFTYISIGVDPVDQIGSFSRAL